MFKLNGCLRANAPALTAASAFGHIVPERPFAALIIKTQGRSRAILDAGQASVAILIHSKVGHKILP